MADQIAVFVSLHHNQMQTNHIQVARDEWTFLSDKKLSFLREWKTTCRLTSNRAPVIFTQYKLYEPFESSNS